MNENNVINVLSEYMKDKKLTITKIASDIGYSRALVSRYMSGKYDGNINEIEDKLSKYMCLSNDENEVIENTVDSRNKTYSIPTLLKNDDAVQLMGVCSNCQKYSEFGMIVGKTGYGKTYVLRQYANAFKKVVMIECDDTMSVRDLIEEITSSIGIPVNNGTNRKKLLRIREFFSINKGYLLIIDEADKLINKYTQKKLDVIRTLIDDPNADVGIVLSGEPNLENLVRSYLERLANRNEACYELNGLVSDEVKDYLKEFNFDNEALEEMIRRATNNKTGCFRILNRTMKNISRNMTSPNELITLDIVMKATRMTLIK